ncbi:MAG: ubiquinol-cytochrome c reductase iron-sulfur subunit [Melioribacteraceae bacterium]|nr:ubiquinol-cytochrome c reductase iron-sulfur subunit [Melioribacteraceae bacterium]MCF8355576.1 ubiquinol-cytochrome c reductase iron-sulfur subunit [Melioribacteraceae bacterium]MCF8395045.1 ubiquinol-cytochrome c reductase iron-sulfur subunit [Melioribacteraceae bacterium]
MNRRKFINGIMGIGGLGTLGAAVYPVLEYLVPPESAEPNVSSLKIGKFSDFEMNSSKIVKFGRIPVIVVKDEKGMMHALAATCTHLDCIVQYRKDAKQIYCACHNGVYDIKGRNLSGPPPKPLEQYAVKIIDDEIIIKSQKS